MKRHRQFPRLLRRLFLRPPTPLSGSLEERLREVERGLREVRGRLNWLLLWMTGAVMAQILLSLMGKG